MGARTLTTALTGASLNLKTAMDKVAVIAHTGDTIEAWITMHERYKPDVTPYESAVRRGKRKLKACVAGTEDMEITHFKVCENYGRILDARGVHGGSLTPEELRSTIALNPLEATASA